jgi:hypothetical protein
MPSILNNASLKVDILNYGLINFFHQTCKPLIILFFAKLEISNQGQALKVETHGLVLAVFNVSK